MFGIGPLEFVVIVIVAVMLFSPRELPGVMRGVARFWGRLRRTADEFRDSIMDDDELRAPFEEFRAAYHGTKAEFARAEDMARKELARARMEVRAAERRLKEVSDHERATANALAGRIAQGEPEGLEPGEAETTAAEDHATAVDAPQTDVSLPPPSVSGSELVTDPSEQRPDEPTPAPHEAPVREAGLTVTAPARGTGLGAA